MTLSFKGGPIPLRLKSSGFSLVPTLSVRVYAAVSLFASVFWTLITCEEHSFYYYGDRLITEFDQQRMNIIKDLLMIQHVKLKYIIHYGRLY